MGGGLGLELLAVIVLVAANAFFVAAEFVLVSIRPTRLRQLEEAGHSAARTALRLHREIDRMLPATQLGITLASLALGWVGAHAVAGLLLPLLAPLGALLGPAVAHTIAIAAAFLIITAMHLVLGELVPKNVALSRSADRLALLIARPMELFIRITQPFLRLMDMAATAVSRLFGAESAAHRHAHSPEELKMLITAGREGGVLQERLETMALGLFDLHQTMVREVMVARPDFTSVSVETPLEELLREVVEKQHSRMPVYEGSPEHFIGVLYVKDLFRVWRERQIAQGTGRPLRRFSLRSLVREALIVPETKPLDQLLEEFQQRRRQMALVVDEFGSITGLVSVEDILQRIVGKLSDEYDVEEPAALQAETRLVLDGSTRIRDMEELYQISLPREQGFETLAGFLMSRAGRIPQAGDSIEFEGWRYTVEGMDGHRIAAVRLDRLSTEQSINRPEAESGGHSSVGSPLAG